MKKFLKILTGIVASVFIIMIARAMASTPNLENYIAHSSSEYSFQYPSTWFVNDTPSGVRSFVSTTITNYDEAFYGSINNKPDYTTLSKITIVKLPKDKNQSFSAWLDAYIALGKADWGTTVLSAEPISVDGYDAMLHTEQLGSLPSPVVYIHKGNFVYIVIGGAFDEKLNAVFYQLVETFHFNS
ncbi:MAG: hypothetical protein AAB407_02370 [Patescibacteria group bacterium]